MSDRHVLFVLLAIMSGCIDAPAQTPAAPLQDPATPDVPVVPEASPGLRFDTVCVTIETAAGPSNIVGTLARNAAEEPTTWVILLPGAQTLRHAFDADAPPGARASNTTPLRAIAAEGYGALAIDRPGMGDSRLATTASDVDDQSLGDVVLAVHALVQALRQGEWGFAADAACEALAPGHAIERVVLGGHSFGGYIAMGYAVEHKDIDGVLVIDADTNGFNREMAALGSYCYSTTSVPGTAAPHQYFCEAIAPLPTCADRLGFEATVDLASLSAFCEEAFGRSEPFNAFAAASSGQLIRARLQASGGIGTPIHFVMYEEDLVWSDAGQKRAETDDEEAFWTAHCGCKVSHQLVERTGHAGMLHADQGPTYAGVVAWLRTL